MDVVAIQRALQHWVVSCTGVASDHVIWGGQQGPRTTQPGIVMSLSILQDSGLPWVDIEPNPLVITPLTIESVNATANTFTVTAHGQITGNGPFHLVGLTLPTNTLQNTNYWLNVIDANTFQLTTSFKGPVLDLADTGSGVMTLQSTPDTRTAGAEIKFKARSLIRAVLTLQCFTSVGTGLDMAITTLWRLNAKRLLPSNIAILEGANIGVIQVDRVKAIDGVQDLVFFEPRAIVDVMLHITSEESETGGIIEHTEITNEATGNTFTV